MTGSGSVYGYGYGHNLNYLILMELDKVPEEMVLERGMMQAGVDAVVWRERLKVEPVRY